LKLLVRGLALSRRERGQGEREERERREEESRGEKRRSQLRWGFGSGEEGKERIEEGERMDSLVK